MSVRTDLTKQHVWLLLLLVIAISAWVFTVRSGVVPDTSIEGFAPRTEMPLGDSDDDVQWLSQGVSEPNRVVVQRATEREAATADDEHVWLLSFGILTNHDEESQKVYVRAAGTRRRATWDADTGRYLADVNGTRSALEATDLVVAAGDGETAKLLPIRVADDGGLNAIGSTPLRSASWDMRGLRIDAGTVQMREPPRLGALVAETPVEVSCSFRIRWEGASRAVSQSVFLSPGESRAELATFLPVTHWTAEAAESGFGQPAAQWSETAQAGEDIAVPADLSTGMKLFISPRLRPKIDTISVLPLEATGKRTVTVGELETIGLAKSMWTLQIGGLRRNGTSYSALRPFVVPPGSYMVEMWETPNGDGVLKLLKAVPVDVSTGFVSVDLD